MQESLASSSSDISDEELLETSSFSGNTVLAAVAHNATRSGRSWGDKTVNMDSVNPVIVTMPPTSSSAEPLGPTTQCIFWSGLEDAVVAQPGFPTENVPPEPSYRLEHIGYSNGMGLVAARSIAAGELIVSERPLLIAPLQIAYWVKLDQSFDRSVAQSSRDFTGDVATRTANPEVETHFRAALTLMKPKQRRAYQALANSYHHDGPLYGVFRTNRLEVSELLNLIPGVAQDDRYSLAAVCEVMSRLNHRSVLAH